MQRASLQQIFFPAMVSLARGFAVVTVGILLSRLLSAVSSILIVRYFNDPASYGQYVALLTALVLMSNLLGLGFDTWLLREGGRDPIQLSFNVRQLMLLKFLLSSTLLGILGLVYYQTGFNWLLIVGLIGVVAESYTRTCSVVLYIMKKNFLIALLQIIDALLTVLLVLFLMNWPSRISFIIIGQSIVSIITLIINLVLVASYLRGVWLPLRITDLVRNAVFFVLADILANVYAQVQIGMLVLFTNDLVVGSFRSAVNLITVTFLIPMAMFNVGLPLLSRPNLERRHRYQLLIGMTMVAIVYGVTMMIGFWLFGGGILQLLYGYKYKEAAPLLQSLCLVPLMKSLSFVAVAAMLALEAQRLRVLIQGVVVIFSLIGGMIMIPYFGVDGATLMYTLTESALCILYWLGALYRLNKAKK